MHSVCTDCMCFLLTIIEATGMVIVNGFDAIWNSNRVSVASGKKWST